MRGLAPAVALIAGLALPVFAQDPGAGRALAERLCAGCHAVAPGEASPEPNAPAFSSFGRLWPVSALQEALAEGIMVAHSDPPMPEISLAPDEIEDLIAYLESIAGSGQ